MFRWSKSRYEDWKSCKKAYYYTYIGRWEGLPGDSFREIINSLKQLKASSLFKGGLIHDIIENQINQHKLGRNINMESARNSFLSKISATRLNQKNILAEAANGFPLSDEDFRAMEEDGLKQLENFFNIIWHNYKDLKYLEHEKYENFNVNGIELAIKFDLFTESPNGMKTITDWKTGEKESPENNMQLVVYLLWAHKKLGIPLENIAGEIVYLKSGKTECMQITKEDTQRLENVIASSSEEMLSVKSEEDFPAKPGPSRCKRCNFLRICDEGKNFLKISVL